MTNDLAGAVGWFRLRALASWGQEVFIVCGSLEQALLRRGELRFFGFTRITVGTPDGSTISPAISGQRFG